MYQNKKMKAKIHFKRAALIAVLIFILWYGNGLTKPFEIFTVYISGSVWRISNFIEDSYNSFGGFLKNKQKLIYENNELRSLLKTALIQTELYNYISTENTELKKILGRREITKNVLARILSQPNRSPYDIFYVDIGKDQNLKVGSLVVSGNILLGVVDTVYSKNSKIRLFSSPGTELQVDIGEKKIPAISQGRGGGMFEIKIPKDIKISLGDAIVHSSIHNYLVGVVLKINLKSTSSFQTILFRAPVNIFTEKFVVVTDNLILLIEEQ